MSQDHLMHKSSVPSVVEEFRREGFAVFNSCLASNQICEFEETYADILEMQLRKLCQASYSKIKQEPGELDARIDKLVVLIDKVHHPSLSEAGVMLRNTRVGHELAASVLDRCQILFDSNISTLLASGPSMFVNLPSSARRKYTAHCESYWYPKRRNFINIWLPVVRERPLGQGMLFYRGSHKNEYRYFSEYIGFEDIQDQSANKQYEIPQSELIGLEEIHSPSVTTGDLIAFQQSMVHSSVDNTTKAPLYAATIRIFDYTEDLTLSANWAETPYGPLGNLSRRIF